MLWSTFKIICIAFLFALVLGDQKPLQAKQRNGLTLGEKSELLSLHKHLIEIESISGNEKEVGDWLSSYLEDAGLKVEKQYVSNTSFNVFAYSPGNRKSKLLVTSHIDTVGF